MSFDLITSGYPGIDHILPVDRAPQPGETGVILQAPRFDVPMVGGCAANIAVAGARLGLRTAVVILVGDDPDGTLLVEQLNTEGVDTQFGVHCVPGGHTAQSFLFVDSQNRHQTFYFPGVSNRADIPIQLDTDQLSGSKWGAITVGDAVHNRTVIDLLAASEVSILWSHKNDVQAFPKRIVEKLAQVSEIAVFNKHEARAVEKMMGLSSIDELLKGKPDAIILTRGKKGSRVITPDREIDVPAVPPGRLVDPTGAGDGFCAGLLFGLIHDLPLQTGCRIGAVVASFVLEDWGCQTNLPTLEKVKTRYLDTFGEDLPVNGAPQR